MKHTIIKLFSVAIIANTFFSCSEPKEEIKTPKGMNVLNLSKYGKPFSIFVPDTNSGRFEVIEQTSGALNIIVGNNFAISINEQFADLELRKSDIEGDEINKFKTYIIKEPDAILWESQIINPEFHFVINKKIGEREFSFEDIHNAETKFFGLEATQRMFDSSKNISENK